MLHFANSHQNWKVLHKIALGQSTAEYLKHRVIVQELEVWHPCFNSERIQDSILRGLTI